jgi:hypothetical protein
MTRGGAASGRCDVKTCCKRPTGWGIGTEILIEDQELFKVSLEFNLLPDKDHGRIGVAMSVSSIRRGHRSYNTDGLAASNNANAAVQPVSATNILSRIQL